MYVTARLPVLAVKRPTIHSATKENMVQEPKTPGVAHIRFSPDVITGRISRYLTGACMEDVYHEVYGGIYSQMLFGESFEEEPQCIDARLNPNYAGLSGMV